MAAKRKSHYEENRVAEMAKVRAYQIKNPDKIKIIKLKHYQTRKAHIIERVSKWRKANPVHAKMFRVLFRAENIDVTLASFTALYKKYEVSENSYWCHYCNCLMPFSKTTIDHIIPISKGGVNEMSNLAVCCLPCNMSKGDKITDIPPRVSKMLSGVK